MEQEKKCDIADIGCGNANCKECDTKTLAKESGVSWQTREREAWKNQISRFCFVADNWKTYCEILQDKLFDFHISRISAIRESIAVEIENIPRSSSQKEIINRAAQIARGSKI